MTARSTLDILVDGLFDYAGMYPPAALDLPSALAASGRLSQLARPHLVGAEFVAGVDHLEQLDDAAHAKHHIRTPGRIAVVGVQASDLRAATTRLQDWQARTRVWHAVSLEVVVSDVDACARVAKDVPWTAESVRGLRGRGASKSAERPLGKTAEHVEGPAAPRLYVEPGHALKTKADVQAYVAALEGRAIGLKLRCAGPRAVGPDVVASALAETVARGIPLKFTQGLHHPLVEPRYANSLGFLGIAMAHALARRVDEQDLRNLVTETSVSAFHFDGHHASWRGVEVSGTQVQSDRREAPVAIGSCDLTEPDEDLVRLFGVP